MSKDAEKPEHTRLYIKEATKVIKDLMANGKPDEWEHPDIGQVYATIKPRSREIELTGISGENARFSSTAPGSVADATVTLAEFHWDVELMNRVDDIIKGTVSGGAWRSDLSKLGWSTDGGDGFIYPLILIRNGKWDEGGDIIAIGQDTIHPDVMEFVSSKKDGHIYEGVDVVRLYLWDKLFSLCQEHGVEPYFQAVPSWDDLRNPTSLYEDASRVPV